MKRAIKVLIPIILALAILLCLAWYLFVYDLEFTRDMLLYGARYFENHGNHALASWFYDQAYIQAGNDDAVAIELAQQHKSVGNYTKAEATLSRAIEDGGGVDVYIALCQTYAEQDKLLDCVKLLNSVTNKQIKSQLDAMRPAAPVAVPEPGFYNQYISITVTAETGTLFVNPTAEYPSIHAQPYSAPVPLVAGENTLYALSVADNGLVSPLAIFGYTIGGVIEQVHFADPAVEAQLRNTLGISENTVLFSNDLWDITSFTFPAETSTYSDLKYLPYLEELVIENGPSGELSVLSSLSHLVSLSIVDTPVSADELAIIGSLPKLEKLTLNGCGLSTVSALDASVFLKHLDLGNNTIRNISPLASIITLQELYLQNNAVNDLASLASLTALTRLNVAGNAIVSLTPLGNLSSLTWLNASNNKLRDIAPLNGLSGLKELYLASNEIADVSPLSACSALTVLDINSNKLADISSLASLDRIIHLDFSHNEVTTLPEFSTTCALTTIDGSHNLLKKLDALKGLQYLNNIHMDYNEKIESVDVLASCPLLVQVDVYGTAVKEVTVLTDQSVIVNYDPTQNN